MSQEDTGKGNTNQLNKLKLSRIRSRRWCYTLNNYLLKDKDQLSQLFMKEKYFIQGEEIGESNTPHLQGYVEFTNQKDLSFLKKINEKIHWEKAKGNRLQNKIYCSKDELFLEKKQETQCELEDRLRKHCLLNVKYRNNDNHIPDDVIQSSISYIPKCFLISE